MTVWDVLHSKPELRRFFFPFLFVPGREDLFPCRCIMLGYQRDTLGLFLTSAVIMHSLTVSSSSLVQAPFWIL